MRILAVTQHFWPENFPIINDLIVELQKKDHQVVVLTGWPNYPAGFFFPDFMARPENYKSFGKAKIVRVPVLPRKNNSINLFINYLSFIFSACIFGSYSLRKSNFDLVFVYAPSPITVALPALFMGRLMRIPVVLWVQDLWPESLIAVGVVKNKLIIKTVSRIVSFIYNRCDLVLGQSNGFVKNIQEYPIDINKVKYFPNWARFSHNANEVISTVEIKKLDGTFDILFAGNIGVAQDFPAILTAMGLLKSNKLIRLWIMGDGRKKDWLYLEIHRLNLQETVFLLPPTRFDLMPSFYKVCDALLVSLKSSPLFSVTIPSKVQSCMTSGLPILGLLDGEAADLISQSGSGMVCNSGNAYGLAENIINMFNMNLDDRLCMGAKGKEFAEREFNMRQLVNQLIRWFNDLI